MRSPFLVLSLLAVSAYADVTGSTQVHMPVPMKESTSSAAEEFITPPVFTASTESTGMPQTSTFVSGSETSGAAGTFSGNYSGLMYGPSLGHPSAYQPRPDGRGDNHDRPIEAKNYLGLGYNITNDLALTPTLYWTMKSQRGQGMHMEDPFVRLSMNRIIVNGPYSLYSDLRAILPITAESRGNDLTSAWQSFQIQTWDLPDSRFTFGTITSERINTFGRQGYGNDLELYIAPNLSYAFSPHTAATLLYQLAASHSYRARGGLDNEGTDLEPGFLWEITPQVTVNPYLILNTGNRLSLASTSVAAWVNWAMF